MCARTWQVTNHGATKSLKVLYSFVSVEDAHNDINMECTSMFGLSMPQVFVSNITDRWQASEQSREMDRMVRSGDPVTDDLESTLASQNPEAWRSTDFADLARRSAVNDIVTLFGIHYCHALFGLVELEKTEL
jgi:hypothetical protein